MLSEWEEQRIQDHFGYARSETRTLAERDAAAAKMTAGGTQRLCGPAFPVTRVRDLRAGGDSVRPDFLREQKGGS